MQDALARFESVMARTWPEVLAQLDPGLDDRGIDDLRAAVAPLLLPRQVEELYRWRGGGDFGLFGAWSMHRPDDLVDQYRFRVDALQEPPAWLPVFSAQMVNIVTLDHPDLPPSDESVWYGHTHDAVVYRLFDSIASLLHIVADAAESGLLSVNPNMGLVLDEVSGLDDAEWQRFRLARSPGAWRSTDAPGGTALGRHPEIEWPSAWLLSLGVTEDHLRLRGATHSIGELLAAAAHGPVSGTVRGTIVKDFELHEDRVPRPLVDDGTGQVVVVCPPGTSPFPMWQGWIAEYDVELESDYAPQRVSTGDLLSDAYANHYNPPYPTAIASMARPAAPPY